MFRCGKQVLGAAAILIITGSGYGLAQNGAAPPASTPPAQAQTAPSSANAAQGSITGTVAYRERMALPPDAAIDVKLQDVSLQDAPAKTLGESVFAPGGKQVPIPFQISYDPADINQAHRYEVRATISVNGKLMFTSTTAYPVINNGAPSQVAIMLQQAPATATSPASATKLRGTHWMLAELNGKVAVPGEDQAARLELHQKGRLAGSTGCNVLAGTYIAEQGGLQFTPAASTMKMCTPPLMEQEQAFFAALKATTGYKVGGGTLELTNGDQVLAKFQAQPKP